MSHYDNPTHSNNEEDYYVLPVIESACIHNNTGFCYEPSCPCHENQESIQDLSQDYQNGLVSAADRDRIYQGKTF